MTHPIARTFQSLLVTSAVALAACEPEPDDGAPPGPCDEVWGEAPASGRLHVDAAASAGGDGSAALPFATLADAIAAARAGGERSIVLAEGEYAGSHVLSNDQAEWLDSGLTIAGCGREQTRIGAIQVEDPMLDPPALVWQPVFDIAGASTAGIVIRDLAVVGGRRAIVVRGGAGSGGAIEVQRVDVLDSIRAGVLLDGASTVARIQDVLVDGVEPEYGMYGWGIAVQTGQSLALEIPEPTVLEDVEILGASDAGVLADGAWLDVAGLLVQGVASLDGTRGRGVHLQNYCAGTLAEVVSQGNADAAIFLESPGRGVAAAQPVEIRDSLLGPTAEADVPGGGTAADGLVATQYADPEAFAASDFRVVLSTTELEGNPRVHVLAETITMEVGTDNIFGKGTDFPLASQGDAIVQGIGGGDPGHAVDELGADDALEVNRTPIALDDLGAD